MRLPRPSISELMAVVAFLACDFAALRTILPEIPNLGLAAMVPILEVGLLVAARRLGPRRAFWVGFEAFGWSYVLSGFALNRPLWRLSRSLYESHILGSPIASSDQTLRLILLASGLQLGAALAVACSGGMLIRFLMSRAPAAVGFESPTADGARA